MKIDKNLRTQSSRQSSTSHDQFGSKPENKIGFSESCLQKRELHLKTDITDGGWVKKFVTTLPDTAGPMSKTVLSENCISSTF